MQLATRLNLETQCFHAPADRPWLDLVEDARIPTEQDYMRALVKTYGFEAPLEAALAYTPRLEALVDMGGRYRSGLIAQDLLTLGLAPGQVAQIRQCMIAPFSGLAEALGWLYVHERATAMHDAVRCELARRSPALAPATAYLGAYVGGTRFEELGHWLETYAPTSLLEDRVVSAAHDAFRTQLQWLDGPHDSSS